MQIDAPGIYDIAPADYHADPCPEPSLSHSIAKLLLRSPMHAQYAHPRLRPADAEQEAREEPKRQMDIGSAVHKAILGKGEDVEIVPFEDYKKEAARDRRDEARALGRIPLLTPDAIKVERIVKAATRQIKNHPDLDAFNGPGQSEATVAWCRDGVWCRALVDRLPDSPGAPIYDVKVTGLSAAPEGWERRMVSDYRMQGPFYMGGVATVRGVMPQPMRFIVIEDAEPYATAVISSAPSLEMLGHSDVSRAIRIWRDCMKRQRWPGYPQFTAFVEAPTYLLTQAEDRDLRDELMEEYA